MLIRDYTQMEKAMSITYAELVDKARELNGKIHDRKIDLCEQAQQLLRDYRESLGVSEENEGVVFIGEKSDGKIKGVNILEKNLDEDYRLTFQIITNLSPDTLNKSYCYTNVTLLRNAGLKVQVEGRQLSVPGGIDKGRYLEVCATIKQSILDSLAKRTPKI